MKRIVPDRSRPVSRPMMGPTRPQYLLLPANVWFIWVSLAVAFFLNLMPWGRLAGVPDFLALTLVFWNIHQPRKSGIGIAFAFGLLMDVHGGAWLGERALAYTLICYLAITLHRRVLWFSLPVQALHVLPLLAMGQIVVCIVRVIGGTSFPSAWWFLQSVVGAVLWPVMTFLLLAPQRRSVDWDENRPL